MSAFCQWLTGNLISETILCSLGYAASICLMFFMVRKHSARYWPYIVAISGYLLLARFYKWYYWLFPVAILYLVNLLQKFNEDTKRYCWLIFVAGIVAGVGSLFRFDLGPVFLCFFIAFQLLVIFCRFRNPIGFRSSVGIYFSGFMISSGIWLGILFWQGGLPAITDYFHAIFSGGSGVVMHWGLSLPPFDWMSPFSRNSATTATLTLLPVVYFCCIGFGIRGRVLDIGCGDGVYSIELLKAGARDVVGVDAAENAIQCAQKNAEGLEGIRFQTADIYRLEKPQERYDVAIARGILHHLYEADMAIEVISRVAEEIVILEPNGFNPVLKVLEKVSTYHVEHEEKSYAPTRLNRWFESCGGKVIDSQYIGLVPMFCPDYLARFLKKLEPIVEALPGVRNICCGQYLLKVKAR